METKKEKAQKIIDTSGNGFHYKVVDYFRSTDWTVMVSPYYTDNYSDKPREIDILAEKEFLINDGFGHGIGHINIKLFIECKYITKESVFWFDGKDYARATSKLISSTPLGDPKTNSSTKKHHYLKETEVAKVFASEKSSDGDIFYKATTQCLHAMIGNFRQPSIIEKPYKTTCRAVLNYPIIICNDFEKIYEAKDNKPKRIDDNFQLEMNYAYIDYLGKNQREYFIIDVVSFDKVSNLISEIVEKDIEAVREKVDFDL
jgi:hypothetical protein